MHNKQDYSNQDSGYCTFWDPNYSNRLGSWDPGIPYTVVFQKYSNLITTYSNRTTVTAEILDPDYSNPPGSKNIQVFRIFPTTVLIQLTVIFFILLESPECVILPTVIL